MNYSLENEKPKVIEYKIDPMHRQKLSQQKWTGVQRSVDGRQLFQRQQESYNFNEISDSDMVNVKSRTPNQQNSMTERKLSSAESIAAIYYIDGKDGTLREVRDTSN